MDLAELLARLGGVALRHQLPVGDRALAAAVGTGVVVRVARGVCALPVAPTPVQAAAALRGVVSHTSAAQLWFLELVNAPDVAHVTVPRGRRLPPRPGVQPHWAALAAGDVRDGVTSPLRTVLDCARTLPLPEGLAVADSALRRGLVTRSQLVARAEALRGGGRQQVLRVARAADARAANPFESALRGIGIVAGLARLVPQLLVRGHRVPYRVDVAERRLRMVMEADSFAWHGDRAALARDCRRYDELVAGGWLVLPPHDRSSAWEQVVFDQERVARTITRAAAVRERPLTVTAASASCRCSCRPAEVRLRGVGRPRGGWCRSAAAGAPVTGPRR